MTAIVKPANLLGLVAFRTTHAIVCTEKQTHVIGMHCRITGTL